jgi:hypothetical protein
MLSGERFHLSMRLIDGETYVCAFRVCISVPVAGDRVAERGVEQLVEINRGAGRFHIIHCQLHLQASYTVPLVFVFTKYDILVTSAILEAANDPGLTDEQSLSIGERSANKVFDDLCIGPLTKAFGQVPVTKVSCA